MTNLRTDCTERLVEVFQALSNRHRLEIFMRLAEACEPGALVDLDPHGAACVGEIGHEIDTSPSTLSHHLKTLRHAGLVRMRRRGRRVECWVDRETLTELKGFLSFQKGNT